MQLCSSDQLLFTVDIDLYPVVTIVHFISGGQIEELILDMGMVRKSESEYVIDFLQACGLNKLSAKSVLKWALLSVLDSLCSLCSINAKIFVKCVFTMNIWDGKPNGWMIMVKPRGRTSLMGYTHPSHPTPKNAPIEDP